MRPRNLFRLGFGALLIASPCRAQETHVSAGQSTDAHDRTSHLWINQRLGLKVRVGPQVVLREDGRDVESLGVNGFLTLEERVGSTTRVADYRPAPGGGVRRTYTVNGQRRDFSEARSWLDRFFPVVLRNSRIDDLSRFERVLAREGVAGVLTAVERITNPEIKAVYLEALAWRRRLTQAEAQRFTRAVESIHSESARQQLMEALSQNTKVPAAR